jgi:signal transduction histidine kinase/CheY-like chemotaxis protein/HPt (histidine-containing phosphotransfer) domain-containing protein
VRTGPQGMSVLPLQAALGVIGLLWALAPFLFANLSSVSIQVWPLMLMAIAVLGGSAALLIDQRLLWPFVAPALLGLLSAALIAPGGYGIGAALALVLTTVLVAAVARSREAPLNDESSASVTSEPPTPAEAVVPAADNDELKALKLEVERLKLAERELERARADAEAAAMSKGEFLATMSHEIRTPLNGVIPLLDILRSTKLEPDQLDYLNTALQSSKHLLRIIDDILDYSKLEANKLELETIGLNLRDLVDSVTQLMGKSAERKGVRLTSTIEPNVRLAMRGDPVRLRQVLTNLVSNAIKFTEKGGIQVTIARRGETRSHVELLFSVRDTGIGMSAETAAKLFQPFSQADASTTRIHGGTGLGLVICKRIIDLMGGKIGVKSEPGKGSIFWFSVSLLKSLGDMQSARRDVAGSRVLMVTADAGFQRRLQNYFDMASLQVLATNTAADALSKLKSSATLGDAWAYDLLAIDLGSMRSTASGLIRNVVREPQLDRVKLLLIAGDEPVSEELRATPRSTLLERNYIEADLKTALSRLLDVVDQTEGQRATEVKSSVASTAATTTPQQTGPLRGHVLLVEDNPVNLQVAKKLVSLIGVSFEAANHGREALEQLERTAFDLVLMDCQMPVLDGYSATRAIRDREAQSATKRIPIIAMTANAMAGDREKCLASGMDDYLSKPLNRFLLEQTLRKWMPVEALNRAAGGAVDRRAAPAPIIATPQPIARPAPTPAPMRTLTGEQPAVIDAPAGPAIDQSVVRDLIEVMGDEFSDLVAVYLEDSPKSLTILDDAIARNDAMALVGPAHSLKSTSANLGATHLSEFAKRIEHGSRQGNLRNPAHAVAQLKAEFQRVQAELTLLLVKGH